MRKKITLGLIMLLAILAFNVDNVTYAEIHHIVAEGTYEMGESDSKEYAKNKAIENAMRVASQKAGVYVEAVSEMQNKVITSDEVLMISASIFQVIDQSVSYDTSTDHWICHAIINADVDDSDIDLDSIIETRKERDTELNEAKQANEALRRKIEAQNAEIRRRTEVVYVYHDDPEPEPPTGPVLVGPKPFDFATASSIEGIIIDAREFHDYVKKHMLYHGTSKVIGQDGTIVVSPEYFKSKWSRDKKFSIRYFENLQDIDCDTKHGLIDFTEMTVIPALDITGIDPDQRWGTDSFMIVIDSAIANALPALDPDHCRVLW